MEDEIDQAEGREVALLEDNVEAEPMAVLEPVRVPLLALRAALACTGEKRTGPDGRKQDVDESLQGINVASREGEIRISATDGHRLFAFSVPCEVVPEWLAAGVTLPLTLLKEQLAMLDKIGEVAVVSYQNEAPRVLVSDPQEHVTFRLLPVKGGFPNYDNVLDGIDLSARATVDLESTSYQASYLKGAADLAKLLDSKSVQVFGSRAEGKPTLVTFPGCPGAVLLLMPLVSEQMIAPQTARVLAGPIAGTIAALRAHRTRWENKLVKLPNSASIQKKIADYDKRIEAILGRTSAAPALPGPADADEMVPFGGGSDTDELVSGVKPEGEIPDVDPEAFKRRLRSVTAASTASEVTTSENRAKLKGAAAKTAMSKFTADINAALSRDNDGLTLSQLADGVPVDDWWKSGLSPEEAAKRCLDWRRVGSVLPPDEVGPGEADQPVAALSVK